MEPPKKLRIPEGSEAIPEKTTKGVVIKPTPAIPPLREWAALFAKADTSPEPAFDEWDITLHDGWKEQ